MTQAELATRMIAEKVESIQATLKQITTLADEFGITVTVFDEWDNRLMYSPRPYIDEYCEIREEGGWYHSTC